MSGLCMKRPNLDNIGEVILPEDYQLRTYIKGDEEAWVRIIKATFPIGGLDWNIDRFQREFLDYQKFQSDSLFFVTYEGEPVGTTCAWIEPSNEGYLHMVAVLPEHQGKRLAYVLCLSAVRFFKENGFEYVKLNTDDHRFPAIKTYLNLGFVPEYIDESHKELWSVVFQKLGSKTKDENIGI